MRIPVELVGLRPSRISPRHKYELRPKRSRCEDKNETKTATRTSSLMTLGIEFMLTTSEHRAAWDTTISAPKSVSLGALVGGDGPYQRRPPRERQRDAE